jgi:hypothetical protein
MTAPRQYATAGALRAALEARLLDRALRDRIDLQRLRRQVAFDRLVDEAMAELNQAPEGGARFPVDAASTAEHS